MTGDAAVVIENGESSAESSAQVASLVRELLAHLGASSTGDQEGADESEHEVLLDLSVQGLRCLVLRPPRDPDVTLSPREREIARMVALGYPNKTIAAVLEISTWTVGTHLRRIFGKLGVHSRAAMTTALHKNGLLSQPVPSAAYRRSRSE